MSNTTSMNDTAKRTGANGLRRGLQLAAVVGVLASATAFAGSKLQTVEECLESGTDLVSLPGVPGGTLSAKECTACSSVRLSFGPNTRYFIGKQAVPYARFHAAASKGNAQLYVFFRPDTHVLTRVRLIASADATNQ